MSMELAQPQTASHPSRAASTPRVRVDKGIPIPPIDRSRMGGRTKEQWLPFRRMAIGDSFVAPAPEVFKIYKAVQDAQIRIKARFTVRTVDEDGERVVRVWRVA